MRRGFTLVELLVVVTIIVILLSLLTPALDQALGSAEKAQCISSVRNLVFGCQQYAFDFRKTLPIYTAQDQGRSSAYDMRTFDPALLAPRYPLSLGLLVPTGYLPAGPQLGKIAHCPVFDNSGGPYPGHCMDVASPWGWGASFWSENAQYRIINGYIYRAASQYNLGKGHMKTNRLKPTFLLCADVPDVRFRGQYTQGKMFSHPDGYARAYGDGSANFLLDPKSLIEQKLMTLHPGSGHMHGGIGGVDEARREEEVWDYMARGSVVEPE